MKEQPATECVRNDLADDRVARAAIQEQVTEKSVAPDLDSQESHRCRKHDPGLLADDGDRAVDGRELDEPIEGGADFRGGMSEPFVEIDPNARVRCIRRHEWRPAVRADPSRHIGPTT